MAKKKGLSYKSTGVDVDANNIANELIAEHVKGTHTERTITKTGTFGGGISLEAFKYMDKPILVGNLGHNQEGIRYHSERILAADVLRSALEKVPAGSETIAFMDYIAAVNLKPTQMEELVEEFAKTMKRKGIDIAGGETAEMPNVFKKDALEVMCALYGVGEKNRIVKGNYVDISEIKHYDKPVLVLSMDGVGTKSKIGAHMRNMKGHVKDITNHSLNDILCQGAKGKAILPAVGCHTIDEELISQIKEGIDECAEENNLAVLDTVIYENKGVYLKGQYDVCASVAGLMDLSRLITGKNIEPGDLVLGLASDGAHTNGFSLIRGAAERAGIKYTDHVEKLGCKLGEDLLRPHRDYSGALLPLINDVEFPYAIKGLAHITGGGMQDNIVRVLPDGMGVDIKKGSWDVSPIFGCIQKWGDVKLHDPKDNGMYETFNMGIGMAVVTDQPHVKYVKEELREAGEKVYTIGKVVESNAIKPHTRVRFV